MDAFISYSRRNLAFVHRLNTALTAHGKQVWSDQKKAPLAGLPPASRCSDEIKHRIETADNFLFIISPESVTSPYCNAEIAHALQHKKRLVTVLYRGTASDAATIQAIDAAIEAIPDDSELPPSVSATITNMQQLARRNWLEIGQIQYVAFSDDGDFDPALETLIRGLDLDLAWIRTWSQVQQAARIWAGTGNDSYLWSEMRMTPVRAEIERRNPEITEIEQEFLKSESQRLLEELEDIHTPHARRSAIGERLSVIGDPRPGVGLREDGLPDIAWCDVPGGIITLEQAAGTFEVEPFQIAKYPITMMQFQAFIDAEDGFYNTMWWAGLAASGNHKKNRQQSGKIQTPPCENVSWYEAIAFCRWLSANYGENIRIPSEWEWQQAATGGNPDFDYPWGPDGEAGWRCNTNESGLRRTTAVGMYPQGASPVGALDMSGNMWEWCLNEHKTPANSELDSDANRVLRGGTWYLNQSYARCAYRSWNNPSTRHDISSFRVCCAPPISS